MSKLLLGLGALLLVGCGGSDAGAVFDENSPVASAGSGGSGVVSAMVAGRAGHTEENQSAAGGDSATAGADAGGGATIAGQGGAAVVVGGAAMGGSLSTVGGAGGTPNGAGSGGEPAGNGGVAVAGGAPQGGASGGGPPGGVGGAAVCQENVTKDCDGKSANGCEVYLCDRNNCGACGNKCFSSQQCICKGDTPNFVYYCSSAQ